MCSDPIELWCISGHSKEGIQACHFYNSTLYMLEAAPWKNAVFRCIVHLHCLVPLTEFTCMYDRTSNGNHCFLTVSILSA